MNTKRRAGAVFLGKGPNGRNLCFCGCGREVNKPRINWFSDACVSAWKEINDPATIRLRVLDRDKSICAHCGVDTEARAREVREWVPVFRWLARRFLLDEGADNWDAWVRSERYASDMAADRFGKGVIARDGHCWEADHIVPVIEGGGQCSLENYRTLCLGCHRTETAKLAARRAQARRAKAEEPQLKFA